jgi:hypothetical protein
MTHPYLAFCPYLPVEDVIEFAGWQFGPLKAFEGRWSDARFEAQAKAFLAKFVDGFGTAIQQPSIFCRQGKAIDGVLPDRSEIEALESAVAFAFLDQNPRHSHSPATQQLSGAVVTADNAELYFWPIDVEAGKVTVSTGIMVHTLSGGFRISDPGLVIRPPLDLHLPGTQRADRMALEAIYRTVHGSAVSPGTDVIADRLRVAIGWLVNAWRNTSTVRWPERIVFLKTAFEAITATNKSLRSAQILRDLFRAVPDTTAEDSDLLVWSPDETANRPRNWIDGNRVPQTDLLTDLEHWFMAFADVRNSIIHKGIVPTTTYNEKNSKYNGHFVFTAEFLLRATIKVSLGKFGYPDLWRSEI